MAMVNNSYEVIFKSCKDTSHEKMCNFCGCMTKIWAVYQNACLCKDCAANFNLVDMNKKIPSEATMLKKILNKKLVTE